MRIVSQIGVAEQNSSGHLTLTGDGVDFVNTGDNRILASLLVQRIAGISDVFSMLYPDKSLDAAAFHERWVETFSWKRTWQTYYRLNWLRSVGLLSKTGASSYALTREGKAFAEQRALVEPAREPHDEEVRGYASLQSLIAAHRAAVKAELRERLLAMSPYQFEHFAAALLEALGFSEVEVTARSGDGGIDGRGVMRVGIVTVKAAFQCKRWKAVVGRPELDRFRGAIAGEYDQGVFIVTSAFSAEARSASLQRRAIPIILLDGDGIVDAMVQHGLGVVSRPLSMLRVDDDFFTTFDDAV